VNSFEKLKAKLAELFQLDQADLDFGIYRIMNARREEIVRFLDKDLLPQVRQAFAEYKSADKAQVQAELGKVIEGLKAGGVDPEQAPKVKELRARLASEAVDITALENEVYDHLCSFFGRYYDEGDFISLRRYKEGVYAIPYEGEEVKLHWANADQYYIKTAENFRDYAFKVAGDHRVHFKIAEADTEKDNVKAANGKDRRFLLHGDKPVAEEAGELVIRFEYRPDEEGRRQDAINALTAQRIIEDLNDDALAVWQHRLSAKWVRADGSVSDKTVLERHLEAYTKKNTFDYFIHKDLGGFLRRELDFYIKNEVMRLDDIEEESAPRVEQYLAKIKALRRIAHKIIDFLAQIENFQKKLWLKKKFVVETNYCVTLDRVPEELYPEIAANDAQREEWVRLFAIDEIKEENLGQVAYSEPLTVEFLNANPFLVLDTKCFDRKFKDRLLTRVNDIDAQYDGLLLHGENFQTLSFLLEGYRTSIKCIYIDPPYNTGADGFVYKDAYQHSTWITMLGSRIELSTSLLRGDGLFFSSIDDIEVHNLRRLNDDLFGTKNFVGTLTWISTTQPDNIGRARFGLQQNIEFVLLHSLCERVALPPFVLKHSGIERKYPHVGRFGACRFEIIERAFEGAYARRTMQFLILGQKPREGKQWQIGEETARALEADRKVEIVDGIVKRAIYPQDEADTDTGLVPFWAHLEGVGTSQAGKAELTAILGRGHGFDTVKPVSLLCRLLQHVSPSGPIMDFFAGSGTTAHAAIELNRKDGGQRKYILVEMGDYFDTVLKPRIQKVVYSTDWKDGKPVSRDSGISHMFKYIRLESYEDALANIELRRTKDQQTLLDEAEGFRESYMLRYMLDVESKGSQTLLNIENFDDPFRYKLLVGTGSAGETRPVNVDLVETFNWLLGLKVRHIDCIEGFRIVEGTSPKGERVLVIWRKIRDLAETDPARIQQQRQKANEDLDAFFRKQQYNTLDSEYDLIYVNGDNNLMNVPLDPDKEGVEPRYKVRLIEEEFQKLMFDVKDV
jgi:adenine-specific DNA-methyltransferase